MSGIYIPGMEMPTSCFYCPFRRKVDPENIMCIVTRELFEETFAGTIETRNRGNCPLVPVPEHGDLIDRDSTIEKIRHLSDEIDKKLGYEKSAPYITMALYLSNADDFPTIIPAEEREE